MTAHTKGPWYFEPIVHERINICHRDDRPGAITLALARVTARASWIEEAQANARLIAAAPDLLTAAKGALAALSQNATFPSDIEAAKGWLRDAIAKATDAPR